MHMDYGLNLTVTQKLIMTPQLQQAIAILQLSSIELAEMVENAILENPVLEVDDRVPEDAQGEELAQQEETPSSRTVEDYLDWIDNYNEGTDLSHKSHDEDKSQWDVVSTGNTLREHLEFQLHLAVFNTHAYKVGQYLIGCIDDNGYLQLTTQEAANALGVEESLVEDVLKIIQTFDPNGVGARTLSECLIIQLRQKGINDPLLEAIVDNYLDEVGSGKYKHIAASLDCTVHDIQLAVDVIRSLNPKPGQSFDNSSEQCFYIVPDVTIEKVNNNFVIIINDNNVPHLTVSPYYRRIVKEADHEAKKFVEGRINAAMWLIKSIEQRRRTLYRVMEAIVKLQHGFFEAGFSRLQPLTMKQVAEELAVHESTVSRTIANKYAETPQGLVSLRTFFSAKLAGSQGAVLSAACVKRDIKELILQEEAEDPLSDQAIADILQKKGIKISRRTVAKYREEMDIAPSKKRKRY